MSDPLKKEQIEDVLSSIRKLVAEDVRAAVKPEAVPAEEPAPQITAEKLLLTPSLRVGDEPAEKVEEAPAAMDVPPVEVEEKGPRVVTLSKTEADFPEATIAEPAVEPEAARAPEAEPETQKPAKSAVDASAEKEEAQPPEAKVVEPEPEVELDPVQSIDESPLPWQSVRGFTDVEYDPEAAGEGDYAGTAVDPIEWETFDALEEDEGVTIDATAEAVETSKPAEPPRFSTVNAEPEQETVIDEDMLRDLVGEIVRQELQGPLGERITRNVRKLVRREINRALATRKLD